MAVAAKLGKSLKDQNRWQLWLVIAANTVFLYTVIQANDIKLNGLKAVFTDASNLVSAGFALLITTVISNLLSADLKARLVFLRWKHALPGHRAFTVYGPRDPRVDMAALAQTYGPDLPTDAAKQNTLWYRIFQTVTDEPQILHTHRDFLLLRDYTAIAAICTLVYGVTAAFCIGSGRICSLYVVMLLVQLVVVRQSAFNSGVRLVTNSLAMACHKKAPLKRSGSRGST